MIIHWSKFQDLKRRETTGLIDTEDRTLEKTQISDAVLHLLNNVETGVKRGGQNNEENNYFLNEEDVKRTGTIVKQQFQRTRWYNGKVVTWLGCRKSIGKGEGASGLRFTFLKK